jgi:hypothetical protein
MQNVELIKQWKFRSLSTVPTATVVTIHCLDLDFCLSLIINVTLLPYGLQN